MLPPSPMGRLPHSVLLAGLTAVLAAATTAPAALAAQPGPCPAAVTAQLDGLYRWHILQQDRRGPMDLSSQRDRFTAPLYKELRRAYALQPADGRYVDFVIFSGTQVSTYAARVLGCSPAPKGRLLADVAVRASLRNRPEDPSVRLRYLLEQGADGRWRIADITYPSERSFTLSGYLQDLLAAPRQPR